MTSTLAAPGVESALGALVETWNRHDMAAYSALFAPDADFVNVVGARLRGRPEIEQSHVNLHRTIFRNSALRAAESSVRFLNEETAVAHVSWEMTGAEGLPGWNVPEVRRGMMTLVLVQDADRWLIAAAHNTDTIPVAMPKP